MDQKNLLTVYDVTAALFDKNQQEVASLHVALNAPTARLLPPVALADIRDGTSRLRAVVNLYALRTTLTRLFEFNSALYSGQLRWINAVDSWSIFFTLPEGTLPVGATNCQELVQQIISELVAASFPGQELQVVFNPDGRYLPRVTF